jgi:signal transduction protein with GAF and PtsI domain
VSGVAYKPHRRDRKFRLDALRGLRLRWIMGEQDSPAPELSHATLLHRISRTVSSGAPLDAILLELIGLVSEVTHCDACLVYLAEPGTGDVVLRASQLPHQTEIGNLRLKPGEGVAGWVAEHRSAVSLPRGAFGDPRFKRFASLVEDTYEALLSAPLITGGDVIGVINVHHRAPHAHSPDEIALVTFIGEQLGGAITNSRLAEENVRLQGEALEMKRQLELRKLVERAKGILQKKLNLSEEEAYLRLRNESRRLRKPMAELAQAVLLAENLGRLSEGLPSPDRPE